MKLYKRAPILIFNWLIDIIHILLYTLYNTFRLPLRYEYILEVPTPRRNFTDNSTISRRCVLKDTSCEIAMKSHLTRFYRPLRYIRYVKRKRKQQQQQRRTLHELSTNALFLKFSKLFRNQTHVAIYKNREHMYMYVCVCICIGKSFFFSYTTYIWKRIYIYIYIQIYVYASIYLYTDCRMPFLIRSLSLSLSFSISCCL